MRQRGFIELPLIGWVSLIGGALILVLGIAVKVQTARLDAVTTAYAKFRGGVEALGLQAKADAAKKESEDKSSKEKADAKNKRDRDALHATIEQLRRDHPGSSFVPAAPAGSSRPELACFDRAEYQRADGVFTAGARGLADEGTAATVDLDTGKRWAQER